MKRCAWTALDALGRIVRRDPECCRHCSGHSRIPVKRIRLTAVTSFSVDSDPKAGEVVPALYGALQDRASTSAMERWKARQNGIGWPCRCWHRHYAARMTNSARLAARRPGPARSTAKDAVPALAEALAEKKARSVSRPLCPRPNWPGR